MFPEAIRAIPAGPSKAFIFENVKGLTRSAFRNYFEYVRLQLQHPEMAARKGEDWTDHLTRLERHETGSGRSDLHYRLVTRVLNAADYGVPQRRERVVFVGFRDDLDIEWAFPKETHSLDALLWDQSRGDYWDRHGVAKNGRALAPRARERAKRLEQRPAALAWRTVRDAIHDLPDQRRTGNCARRSQSSFSTRSALLSGPHREFPRRASKDSQGWSSWRSRWREHARASKRRGALFHGSRERPPSDLPR